MRGYSKNIDRDKMAVELYFSVLRIKKSEGLTHRDAKDLAYDAVELRYNISPKRLQNIISDNRDVLTCNKNMFINENERLAETLEEANRSMLEHIEENNRLINLLKEVNNV
jgi:hypothetical protein